MTYDEGRNLVRSSGSLEGVAPTAIADTLVGARNVFPTITQDDVKAAAAAAYELGKLGLERQTFFHLNGGNN